eukprot:484316-Amphidinium_carterae.1
MSALIVHGNCFAGTLPNRAFAGLGTLSVKYNTFEGKMSHPHLLDRKLSTACFALQRQESNLQYLQGISKPW